MCITISGSLCQSTESTITVASKVTKLCGSVDLPSFCSSRILGFIVNRHFDKFLIFHIIMLTSITQNDHFQCHSVAPLTVAQLGINTNVLFFLSLDRPSSSGQMHVRLVFRRSRVRSSSPATFFRRESEIGHEIISMAILFLPLIQVGQLSVTGEKMCTKYWLTH